MTKLLPVGTIVLVTEEGGRPYVGKVVGYDIGHTKYQISQRIMGWNTWMWTKSVAWPFPSQVEALDEADVPTLAGICAYDGRTVIYNEPERLWEHVADGWDDLAEGCNGSDIYIWWLDGRDDEAPPRPSVIPDRRFDEHEICPVYSSVELSNVWDIDAAWAGYRADVDS